jgi:glutaredoxin/glutathione-dependent peroxiredoxin
MMIATSLDPGEAMTLSVGDRIPDVTLVRMTGEGPARVGSGEALGSGTVVLFGVPGAFTPICSDHHLPGYVLRADELWAKGVDTVACIAVNDVFVLDAWGDSVGAGDKVVLLGDGNGEFAAAAGLEFDGSAFGLGTRSQRYAAILKDGVVQKLMVEPDPLTVTVSSADTVLGAL